MHIYDIGTIFIDMVANSKLSGDIWSPIDEPVGVNEISELLGVEVTTVSSWRQRHVLPRPDKIINAGKTPIWKADNIIKWADATGRNNKNIKLDNTKPVDDNVEDELQNFQVKDLDWEI